MSWADVLEEIADVEDTPKNSGTSTVSKEEVNLLGKHFGGEKDWACLRKECERMNRDGLDSFLCLCGGIISIDNWSLHWKCLG